MRLLTRLRCVLFVALLPLLFTSLTPMASASNFNVNDLGDTPDANTSDGICADSNFNGYNFWLNKLNSVTLPGEDARDERVALARVRRAEMIRAFLLSAEYRGRFGGDPSRGQ